MVPLLLDTDPGIDDALALLFAFRAPGARVVAVTTVAGNVPVDVATRNVARVLGVARPDPVPRVAAGAAGPRARPLVTAMHIHGPDGLGGVGAVPGPDGGPRFPQAPLRWHGGDAADLLVASARRRPGELVIVALGPLTNVALAVARDPRALRGVRALVVMGGAIAVGGNASATAEFNMFVDPESAADVLAARLPLTLVPLDVTREVVWSGSAIERFRHASDPITRFACAVAGAGVIRARLGGEPGITMHDPLAVGVALDPTLVETESVSVRVQTDDGTARGMTVVDRGPSVPGGQRGAMTRVATRVDAARFLRTFEERLCAESA